AHRFVVRADEHHPARDHWIPVALRSELGDPLDVLLRLDVPLGGQPLHVRDHVAVGRAAPHRPDAGAGITRGFRLQAEGSSSNGDDGEREQYLLHWFFATLMLSM